MRLAALLLLVAPAAAAFGKCGPDAPASAGGERFETRTPVFVFEARGRFLRGDLSTGEWKVVSDRGFDYAPSVRPSPDGRWISYSGTMRGQPATEYWLYDKRTGTDRLYHQHAKWGGSIPAFSPDSKWLAVYVNYDTRWPSGDGAGLYVFEVDSAHATPAGNPSKFAAPANQPYASADWSKEGRELLLMVKSFPRGLNAAAELEYFAYLVGERRFERIEGKWNGRSHLFFRGGASIAAAGNLHPQWSHRQRVAASPDGRWQAEVGPDYVLKVVARDGAIRKVASGHRDDCAGETIGINGWLDARHMVYTVSEQHRVFDVATGRDALLYAAGRPAIFLW